MSLKVVEKAELVDAAQHGTANPNSQKEPGITVDAVSLPSPQTASRQASFVEQALVPVHIPQRDHNATTSSLLLIPGRAANRKARKERRIWAGTFKPGAQSDEAVSQPSETDADRSQSAPTKPDDDIAAVSGHPEPDNGEIESVLKKLDAEIEGPPVQKTFRGKTKAQRRKEKKEERAEAAKGENAAEARGKASEADRARKRKMEAWGVHKAALENKFGESGWAPRKRLSPDSLEGIRALHASDPETYTTAMLSKHFQVSPENIRRILKSKWRPKPEEIEERMERWERRGVKKWLEMAEKGMKPPKKWRVMGVPNPKLEMKKKWEDLNKEQKPKRRTTGARNYGQPSDQLKQAEDAAESMGLAGRIT